MLLTDRRWRIGVSQLIRRIDESGCVDAEDLDELAESFLAADRVLYWEVPEEWFGDEDIIVTDIDSVSVDDGDAEGDADEPDYVVGACAAREVHPSLRRWATARLAARDPTEVESLLERTDAVDARAAAAIMAGVLDVVDRVDGAIRDQLIDAAVRWPEHGVRRAGIELVAARDGAIVAHELAARDPNARIRDWAQTLLAERMPDAADSSDQDQASAGRQGGGHQDDQQSLF